VTGDFYCDEVLSGHTPVERVAETDNVLAFHHTRPFYPIHFVIIPKRHITSLIALEPADDPLILELFGIIKQVAAQVVAQHGACRVVTNLGDYQDSKHLHWHIISGEPLRKTDI
jgi:histidine triad (HIT) family protein